VIAADWSAVASSRPAGIVIGAFTPPVEEPTPEPVSQGPPSVPSVIWRVQWTGITAAAADPATTSDARAAKSGMSGRRMANPLEVLRDAPKKESGHPEGRGGR
jgi:hypothetical protein